MLWRMATHHWVGDINKNCIYTINYDIHTAYIMHCLTPIPREDTNGKNN